jgi:hypothetical protein
VIRQLRAMVVVLLFVGYFQDRRIRLLERELLARGDYRGRWMDAPDKVRPTEAST